MPSDGRRLHPFTVVSRGLGIARQLLLPAIVGGASVADGLGPVIRWTLVILAIPSLAIAVAQWLAFRYRLVDDELIIDSGVISRRRRVIPVARVQNVDLQQSALERIARVGELRIETASGGSETEAGLAVLRLDEARALQAELLRRRAGSAERRPNAAPPGHADSPGHAELGARSASAGEPGTEPAGDRGAGGVGERPAAATSSPEQRILSLSVTDLVVAGATSNEAGLIAAGLATLLEVLGDFGGLETVDGWIAGLFEGGLGMGITGPLLIGAGLVLVFVVLGWLVSIVVTTVRFHAFTLTRAGGDLRRDYGLFSRHHSTVPLERIQAVRIEQTLLRRPLGLVALKIETAGAGPQQRQNAQGGGAEAYVPIARRGDVGRLLRAAFEDARFDDVELHGVHPASRRRAFFRLAAPVLAGTAIAAWLDPVWLGLAGLLVPAWFMARAQYRARAWARADGYTIVRAGVLTRTSWVVPERKIQTMHVHETPFQRRWDLATLMIDTAAGGRVAQAVDLGTGTAERLLLDLAAGQSSG